MASGGQNASRAGWAIHNPWAANQAKAGSERIASTISPRMDFAIGAEFCRAESMIPIRLWDENPTGGPFAPEKAADNHSGHSMQTECQQESLIFSLFIQYNVLL
jgi:hypothetical protein